MPGRGTANAGKGSEQAMLKEDLKQDVEARVAFLRRALAQAGAQGFVYGNSGGKDLSLIHISKGRGVMVSMPKM